MSFGSFFPGYYRNVISQVATYLLFFEKLFSLENNNNFLMSSIYQWRCAEWGTSRPNLFIIISNFPVLGLQVRGGGGGGGWVG